MVKELFEAHPRHTPSPLPRMLRASQPKTAIFWSRLPGPTCGMEQRSFDQPHAPTTQPSSTSPANSPPHSASASAFVTTLSRNGSSTEHTQADSANLLPREPPGYFDQLRAKEPIVLWDDKGVRPALMTEADWIAAGKLVFDSPIGIGSGRIAASMSTTLPVRDPRWDRDVSAPLTPEEILPFYRYVIRERGKVEVGVLSCAMCHTRVMPDGSVISGAQGNFPFGAVFARDFRDGDGLVEINRRLERQLYAAPWIQPDPQAGLGEMSLEQIALPHSVIPPGVVSRHRSSPMSPVQVPDLIGLKERRYLDRTGLQRHRDIVDLMRYAALNQGGDDLASYGGFVPATAIPGQMPSPEQASFGRYSDEQLYALALFAYSL